MAAIAKDMRVRVDVAGLQRTSVSMIANSVWVDGTVTEIAPDGRRVTVILQTPVDGKAILTVAPGRVKAA